ncbi:amidohydrolase family protein [candidate division KSB1 bacterium]
MPGFINSHVHTAYNAYKLNRWVVEGVTTVRDLGVRPYSQSLFNFKKSNNGKELYARLVIVGPFFTCANGYPMIPFGGPPGYIVNSPEDARNKTAAIINEGADVIKIGLESGKTWDINIPVMSDQEVEAIINEAHKHNIPVSAHILSVNDLEHAVNLGVDEIAHMASDENIPDTLIQEIIKKNIYLVPTLELWLGISENRSSLAINNLNKFVEAGGKVALGTDYMGYTIEWELGMPKKEILAMQDAGMSPMQIITASTKNAAHVCNLEDEIGTISEGKIADIIVVEGNPLEDIKNIFQPSMVIHYGKIIVNKKY